MFLAVKHDCVFGDDLDLPEISFVSDVWSLSLSITYMAVTHMLIH